MNEEEKLMEWSTKEFLEAHRREYSEFAWAKKQPQGPPRYKIGDVVEFHAGGFGVISDVLQPKGGIPSSYSTRDVDGYPGHARKKIAWHYEGDFKRLVAKSPLHFQLPCE